MDLLCEYGGDSDDESTCVKPKVPTNNDNASCQDGDYFNLSLQDDQDELHRDLLVEHEVEFLRSQMRLDEETHELSDIPLGPNLSGDKRRFNGDNFSFRCKSRKPNPDTTENSVHKTQHIHKDADSASSAQVVNPKSIAKGPRQVKAHSKAVTSIQWNPIHSNYLVSCSFDGSVKIWNAITSTCLRTLLCSAVGVNDCLWMPQGLHVLTGGYDQQVQLIDSELGSVITTCHHDGIVSCLSIHPSQERVFLSGIKDAVCAWDLRLSPRKPIRFYRAKAGQVLDIEFLGGDEFVCSTGIVSRESADRSIMAWDFSSGTLLSNQIFQEHYTCPCLRVDPKGNYFLAQTHGGYIAIFSTSPPYKMNKTKCFKGHKLSGYGIQCDIDQDGRRVISGDADGHVFIYDAYSTRILKDIHVFPSPSVSVAFHPFHRKCFSVGAWSGELAFFL